MELFELKLSLCLFSTEHRAMKAHLEEWRYSSSHSLLKGTVLLDCSKHMSVHVSTCTSYCFNA
jgi:hypothetical protein